MGLGLIDRTGHAGLNVSAAHLGHRHEVALLENLVLVLAALDLTAQAPVEVGVAVSPLGLGVGGKGHDSPSDAVAQVTLDVVNAVLEAEDLFSDMSLGTAVLVHHEGRTLLIWFGEGRAPGARPN